MAIADEAAAGFGFLRSSTSSGKESIDFYANNAHRWLIDTDRTKNSRTRQKSKLVLPFFPYSWCNVINPSEACVQPKAGTPQVGCTVRSLSHNLALLPPKGEIETFWDWSPSSIGSPDTSESFTLLLVPFPFSLDGRAIKESRNPKRSGNYFAVDPKSWCSRNSNDLAVFLKELIKESEKDGALVDAVVMPELALRYNIARQIDETLLRDTNVEMFITGILEEKKEKGSLKKFTNSSYRRIGRGKQDWNNIAIQSKHHRWCLERSQIERYRFGHKIHSRLRWWEDIDLSQPWGKVCSFSSWMCLDGIDLRRFGSGRAGADNFESHRTQPGNRLAA